LLAVGFAVVLVSACGGGGGYAGTPAGTFDVNAGWRNLLTGTRNFTLTGTGPEPEQVRYTVAYGLTPAPVAPFPVTGVSGSRLVETITLTPASGTPSSGTSTIYFDPGILALIGTQDSDGTCARATSATAPPSSALSGATGALASVNNLNGCATNSTTTSTENIVWQLVADSGISLLCINSGPATTGTQSSCVEIIGSGALGNRARITVSIPLPAGGTFSLTARNF
jgi:hypothetical protein